jgi:hypothetical protein
MTKENKFHIIKDTREKKGHGWWYDENAYCSGTTVAKVDIGDYAIEGMEHVLAYQSSQETVVKRDFMLSLKRCLRSLFPF